MWENRDSETTEFDNERTRSMRMHENFTRCTCESAYLVKETYVLAHYHRNENGIVIDFCEIPDKQETRYTCSKCKTLVFVKREL